MKSLIRWIKLILIMVIALMTLTACGLSELGDQPYFLVVQNRTDELISIYANNIDAVIDVEPGKEKVEPLAPLWHITVKNKSGEILFSLQITREQIENSGATYKGYHAYVITIQPKNRAIGTDNSTISK